MNKRAYGAMAVVIALLVMVTGCKGEKQEFRGTEKAKEPAVKPVRNTLATAEETVKAFCEQDGKGARLTSKGWSKMLPYISWKDEPGWDSIIVISGYEIVKTEKKGDARHAITVSYHVVGTLSQDYLVNRRVEQVTFTVKKTDAGWKITDPDVFPPHVYINPVITHLEETKNYELAQRVQTGRSE